MKKHELDPLLHGIAPIERDVHAGTVYLTMAGLMRKLGVSRAWVYRMPGLMSLRRTLSPGVMRWLEHEVDEYFRALTEHGKPPALKGRARLRAMSRAAQQVVDAISPAPAQIRTARKRKRNLRAILREHLADHQEGAP